MDYEKEYKKLKADISKAHLYAQTDSTKAVLEFILPELKESGEERIRKELVDYLTNELEGKSQLTPYTHQFKAWIAWLEKQTEARNIALRTEYEKGRADAIAEMQKPTDKVEPKFHEGEWIIHQGTENIYQVVACVDNQYQLKYGDNYTTQYCEDVDRCARLWDITKDAKDGDVLYSLDTNQPFIYKARNIHEQATAYCGINKYGKFFVWNTNDCIITLDKYIPATKEQRDTLMKAMTDAGYTFDFEKKELKEIEDKPLVIDEGKAEMDYCFTKMMKGEKVTPAWSEEDEEIISMLIDLVEYKEESMEVKVEFIAWLKSLKDRIGG